MSNHYFIQVYPVPTEGLVLGANAKLAELDV